MEEKKKGFWKTLIEKIDKKMEDKAKQGGCCCSGGPSKKTDDKKSSCCS